MYTSLVEPHNEPCINLTIKLNYISNDVAQAYIFLLLLCVSPMLFDQTAGLNHPKCFNTSCIPVLTGLSKMKSNSVTILWAVLRVPLSKKNTFKEPHTVITFFQGFPVRN